MDSIDAVFLKSTPLQSLQCLIFGSKFVEFLDNLAQVVKPLFIHEFEHFAASPIFYNHLKIIKMSYQARHILFPVVAARIHSPVQLECPVRASLMRFVLPRLQR